MLNLPPVLAQADSSNSAPAPAEPAISARRLVVRARISVIGRVSMLAPTSCPCPYNPTMNRIRLLVLNAALGPLDYRLPDGIGAPAGQRGDRALGPAQGDRYRVGRRPLAGR